MMDIISDLHNQIIQDLQIAGADSPYTADANEPDPEYKSYGVRAEEKKKIFQKYRQNIRNLEQEQQTQLAYRLIQSGYGEQQSIGLFILEPLASWFVPKKFAELDGLIRCLRGWSKVDAFTGSLLSEILFQFPDQMKQLIRSWNCDQSMWLQRTSVVIFTRKVAKSGKFNEFALEMCSNLMNTPEELVQKGVGWALKDLMHTDRDGILAYVSQLRQQGVSSTITLYALKNLKGAERAAFFAREKRS